MNQGTAAVKNTDNTGLYVELAGSRAELREAQALRYRVFTEEFGAQLDGGDEQLDRDLYDDHCHHLLVRDRATGAVIGCTRILTDQEAPNTGGFYSASEFDLSNLHDLPGRVMEVGRTCVHPDYRGGATIAVLWSGVAGFIALHRFDYVIGCVSIGLGDGGVQAQALMQQLRDKLVEPRYRVRPLLPLPAAQGEEVLRALTPPPLLKAYLRLGARVAGDACIDPLFNVADLFVLLDVAHMQPRYRRHFIERHDDFNEQRIA